MEVEARASTARCPYCASPQVIERQSAGDRTRPLFGLGFSLPRSRALAAAAAWKRSKRVFAPGAFNRASLDEIRGVYLPVYLYCAEAHATYAADIGETYTTGTGKNRRTRTDWFRRSGVYSTYVDDLVVSASQGLPQEVVNQVAPFQTTELRRYTPKLIAGWACEEPTLTPDEALPVARQQASDRVSKKVGKFLPGDRSRILDCQVTVHNEHAALTVVPLWILAVRYHDEKPPARVVVNGQTGKTYGQAPTSWLRVAMAILLVLLLGAGIYVYFTST